MLQDAPPTGMTTTEIIALTALFVNVITFVVGQFIAIRVARYLDDQKAKHSRKIQVFKMLMATRATNLSATHVEALNSITLEFTDNTNIENEIILAWRTYLDWLSIDATTDGWGVRRIDLLVDLLHKISIRLGYKFDKLEIKNGIYIPKYHGDVESDQEAIRSGFRMLLEGKRSIPMYVVNWPNGNPDNKAAGAP